MSFLSQPVTLQSLFGEDRTIGEITVDVIINESTNDTLVITKQPVQRGASISDHAYKEPTGLSMKIRMSDNLSDSLSDIYRSLLSLQTDRAPFDVLTPKRAYRDMLIASLGVTTDKFTENVLAVDITFQQVLLVDIGSVRVPASQQRTPEKTAPTQPTGNKTIMKKALG